MKYAIETLKIEEYKLREAIRVEEKYSVYPEYKFTQIEYKERLIEILKAIELLEKVGWKFHLTIIIWTKLHIFSKKGIINDRWYFQTLRTQ